MATWRGKKVVYRKFFLLTLGLFFGILAGKLYTTYNDLTSTVIDDEFLPYIEEYKKYKKTFTKNDEIDDISIIFGSLSEPTIGKCYYYPLFGPKIIKIDAPTWYAMQNIERELLIIHELGHCDLGILIHSDNPADIMYYRLTNPEYYKENKLYMLYRLFNGNN